MAETRPPRFVVPTPQPARLLGGLNVAFGAILMTCAAWALISTAFTLLAREPMEAIQRIIAIQSEAEHERTLGRLRELEAAAEHESARDRFRQEAERREAEGPRPAAELELMSMGFDQPGLAAWTVADATTGIALNVLMLVSGAGLLQLADWARKLAVWVAGLKIARLVLIWGFWIAVIVPEMSRSLGAAVEEAAGAQGGGGAPPIGFTQLYAVIYTVWGVVMIVLGSIYPAVLLWVLTRPGVRAACRIADRTAAAASEGAGGTSP